MTVFGSSFGLVMASGEEDDIADKDRLRGSGLWLLLIFAELSKWSMIFSSLESHLFCAEVLGNVTPDCVVGDVARNVVVIPPSDLISFSCLVDQTSDFV